MQISIDVLGFGMLIIRGKKESEIYIVFLQSPSFKTVLEELGMRWKNWTLHSSIFQSYIVYVLKVSFLIVQLSFYNGTGAIHP